MKKEYKKHDVKMKKSFVNDTKGIDDTEEFVLKSRFFSENVEPIFVRYGKGETISLGKYEFVRFDISITVPCLTEELTDVYNFCEKFVESKIKKEHEKLK